MSFADSISTTHGRSLILSSDAELDVRRVGQSWMIAIDKVAAFGWRSGEASISYKTFKDWTAARASFWFAHIVLPFYLALEGDAQFLHASALEWNNHAILFTAPSFGGKSTIAKYLYDQGFIWMSDDKVGIRFRNDRFLASPSLPFSRPFRESESLGTPVERFSRQPRELGAVFRLRTSDAFEAVSTTRLDGFRKYESLWDSDFFGFYSRRQVRFEWLARLADRVPVFELKCPWGLDRLQEVAEVIEGVCASLKTEKADFVYSQDVPADSNLISA